MDFLPENIHGGRLVRSCPRGRRVRVPPGGPGPRRHGVHQSPAQQPVGGGAV